MKAKKRSLDDKFWHDKNGKFVVFQPLNIWIVLWFMFSLLAQIVRSHPFHALFGWVSFGALVVWALLEVVSGVNYFRRLLGLTILLLTLAMHF
jgi:hypothetical protein